MSMPWSFEHIHRHYLRLNSHSFCTKDPAWFLKQTTVKIVFAFVSVVPSCTISYVCASHNKEEFLQDLFIITASFYYYSYYYYYVPFACISLPLLGAFAKCREKQLFVMWVCPSLHRHWTTRLPESGFSWNFTMGTSTKICRPNSSLFQIRHKRWILYIKVYINRIGVSSFMDVCNEYDGRPLFPFCHCLSLISVLFAVAVSAT